VYGATVRFHGGNLNDQPAHCALPPTSGPEIARQEAAENRVGALGGELFLADLVGNMRRHLAVGAPVGGELDALEARAETAGRDPGRLHRQPQNRKGSAGPGCLKLRFVGSAELQVMV
jgi:hypothetical protein